MQQFTQQISVKAQGRKLYDITPQVLSWANQLGLNTGLLTLYIQHTSASLLINENYDSDVLVDMERPRRHARACTHSTHSDKFIDPND